MRDEEDAPPLDVAFGRFARTVGPRYALICSGVARDPELLALAAVSPVAQRRPNLLLAAAHFLLLSGADHPLVQDYPTVVAWRRGLQEPAPAPFDGGDPARGLFDRFRAFCLTHREELEPLLRTRATQTNEIGRCAFLLPALAVVGTRVEAPIQLIDLGAAAGLNLLFDHYSYDYGGDRRAGASGSAVQLTCALVQGDLPPLGPLRIAGRLGLDEAPVDPADEDGTRWQLACQWPDDVARFTRMRAALAIARKARDTAGGPLAPVRRGDLVDDLAAVIEGVAPDRSICLLCTWAAAYLSPERQGALLDTVVELGRRRPLVWLLAEQAYEVPALPLGAPRGGVEDRRATAVALLTADAKGVRVERLADSHPHGAWLRWYAAG